MIKFEVRFRCLEYDATIIVTADKFILDTNYLIFYDVNEAPIAIFPIANLVYIAQKSKVGDVV